MTTSVKGTSWTLEGSRLIPVDDSLTYEKGWPGSFRIYRLHNEGQNHNVSVTDGPEATFLDWEDGILVTIDGQVENPPDANYQLKEGNTLVAKGPLIDAQRAELTITFIPTGSREQHS